MRNAGSKNRGWIAVFLIPTLVVFILLFALPLGTTVVSSFTKWNGMEAMKFIGLGNYEKVLGNKAFYSAFQNTMLWMLFAIVIHVPLGTLVALVLHRRRPGWKFTRAVFLIPNMISKTALSMLFVFIFKPDIGILNSFLRAVGLESWTHNWLNDAGTALLSITNIWLWYAGLTTLIVMSELSNISPELAESASIDGATPWQIDTKIYLPQLRRIIGTAVFISVIAVFKEFDSIYMTTSGGPGNASMNLSMLMYNRITNSNNYGFANAVGTILMLMSVAVMIICNKLFHMDSAD